MVVARLGRGRRARLAGRGQLRPHPVRLDAATGERLWSFTTGGPVYAAPVFFRDGDRDALLAASTDRLVYAIDASNGRQVWVHSVEDYRPTLGGARLAAPCVGGTGDSDNAVFVAYWVWDRSLANSLQKSGVLALALADGKPLWRQELGDNDLTAAIFVRTAGHGQLFLGSANGNIYALDAATGAVQWKKTELDGVRSPPAFFVSSSGPLVVTGSKYGTVRGLDATTGAERWNYKTGDRIAGSPAILVERGGARAFVGSYDRFLHALDATNGSLIWRYAARGGLYSSPALVDSGGEAMALVLGWDHMLHAAALKTASRYFPPLPAGRCGTLPEWTTATGRRPRLDAFAAAGWPLWAATTAPCALCRSGRPTGQRLSCVPIVGFGCPSLWCCCPSWRSPSGLPVANDGGSGPELFQLVDHDGLGVARRVSG